MLGYRTIFDVPQTGDDTEVVALSELRSWLREKKLDADALAFGKRVGLAPGVTGFLQELDNGDGSRSVRARIVERRRAQRWVSTLTIHRPSDGHRPPWVWVDIDGPDGQVAGIPRLARNLLGVFTPANTQVAHLSAAPEIVSSRDVDELTDALLDDSRRRLMFIAGSDDQMPLVRWQALLRTILRDTVGLASAYVLDAGATGALSERLGNTHVVLPGTVRTFVDHVRPYDALDAQRHRVLSTRRIVNSDPKALARILGDRARAVALQQPLPRAAIRIDRLFERQIDALVLLEPEGGHTTPPGQSARIAIVAAAATIDSEALPDERATTGRDEGTTSGAGAVPEAQQREASAGSAVADESVTEAAEGSLALRRLGHDLFGRDQLSAEDIDRLVELAQRGLSAEQQHAALSERLAELQDAVEASQDEVDGLKRRLDDEQLEVATTTQELRDADRLVQKLRQLLASTDAAAEAWLDPEVEDAPEPSSFGEVLARFSELPRVVLTMPKTDVAHGLDIHNPLGTWAGKTWQALVALRDYAASKADGTCEKDVDGYLRNPPTGRCTFSATRHARDESEPVRNTPKFRDARVLPVPQSVDPDGVVFMGAHFKIAQAGLISPRVHYYDATAVDGNIYVGYIGPHLPTKQTN
ncbi:hypothetical protein CELD12_33050 [Cellulomonas sp. NTE-D12]|nr:hypothetical protein CELD12_33050 [Cellulomonas sp. NTE-D12]